MATAELDSFARLGDLLKQQGPEAALEQLIADLREKKDYTALFYALLMKKRHELGVSPIPTGPAQALPQEVHLPYEDAIRAAAQHVAKLYLEDGNIPGAWTFYRMLGETAPVKDALENVVLVEGEDCQPLVDIAYQQGVHPTKGFDLVLDRYGICSAITMVGSGEFPHGPQVRDHCIKRLIRSLHNDLVERLAQEIERSEGTKPATRKISELVANRPALFADDLYHIDVSHLGAVVQMAIHLSPCPELEMARELCVYGQHLSPRFQFGSDPPFEDQYRDYGVYLAILAGDDVEGGLAHFRAKVEAANPEEVGTFPAEVFVNLLCRLDRHQEALAIARKHLGAVDARRLTCPGIVELCEKTGDFTALAEVAREQGNTVQYLAGLLAARKT